MIKRYTGQGIYSAGGTMYQVMRPGTNTAISVQLASNRVALPGEAVRVATTVACRLEFGGSTVTAGASSILFPEGVEVLVAPEGATHIALIRVGDADGIGTITEML